MHKNLILILISCIFISFFLSACEPGENYELAAKKHYVDGYFDSGNYLNEAKIREFYWTQRYPTKFNVKSETDLSKLFSVAVATPMPQNMEDPAFDEPSPFSDPDPYPNKPSLYVDPIPGAGKEVMKTGPSSSTSNINLMVIKMLEDMYPANDPPNWNFTNYSDGDVNTAMLRTIMYDPQITARIQRDVQTNCRFRGVLVSGSDVVLSSIETSGAIYCLGSLCLANGSKVVGDSKYIGDCIELYNKNPVIKRLTTLYETKFPISMNRIPQRTELFSYMEINLEEPYRKDSFESLASKMAQPNGFRTILNTPDK